MDILPKINFLVNVAYWALIIAIVCLVFKYLFPVLLPFIIGACIATLIVKFSNKLRCNSKAFRIIITILFFGTIGTCMILLLLNLFSSLYDLVLELPDMYKKELLPAIDVTYKYILGKIGQLDPSIIEIGNMMSDSLLSSLTDLVSYVSGYIVSFLSNVVTGIPSLFISVLLMIISTFFFVVDYDRIKLFLHNNMPAKITDKTSELKEYLYSTIFVVLRSYALIMLITFSELSILFLIFGIDYPFLIAGIIAVFDILPILGSGGILIPWVIISLILGDAVLAVKLTIIYLIITVVRNYIEPKIVGVQLGLHPLITLVSMFIGLRLFGFIGMFGIPVSISYLWKKYKTNNVSEM